jgi:hypothetical protein
MSIYLMDGNLKKELLPEEVYALISDENFYKVSESNGFRFEASGNKIKNQIRGLLRLEKVVITPIK